MKVFVSSRKAGHAAAIVCRRVAPAYSGEPGPRAREAGQIASSPETARPGRYAALSVIEQERADIVPAWPGIKVTSAEGCRMRKNRVAPGRGVGGREIRWGHVPTRFWPVGQLANSVPAGTIMSGRHSRHGRN